MPWASQTGSGAIDGYMQAYTEFFYEFFLHQIGRFSSKLQKNKSTFNFSFLSYLLEPPLIWVPKIGVPKVSISRPKSAPMSPFRRLNVNVLNSYFRKKTIVDVWLSPKYTFTLHLFKTSHDKKRVFLQWKHVHNFPSSPKYKQWPISKVFLTFFTCHWVL